MTDDLEAVMQTGPPHLVVQYRMGPDGSEQFQWGMTGHIPLLTLLGRITRVQSQLTTRAGEAVLSGCKPPVCVFAWLGDLKQMRCWVSPEIPPDALVGMLETVKMTIMQSAAARAASPPPIITPHNGRGRGILGPDGSPFGRR